MRSGEVKNAGLAVRLLRHAIIGGVALAAACAHSGRMVDPQKMPFDGESPSMVRIAAGSDMLDFPHPVVRGDSLVAKYGYGRAVAFEDIESIQQYEEDSGEGMGTGGVILITALAVVVALGGWISTLDLGGF